jgi:hypothetical protein
LLDKQARQTEITHIAAVTATAAVAAACRDADSYVAFDNKRYYKNANTYNQYMSTFLSDPSALTFEPAWFWDQVDPLAGLSLQCKNG